MTLLKSLTTFRIGGPCDTLYTPADTARMTELLKTLESPIILGGGSNILAADSGVREPLILTTEICDITVEGNYIRAGCGATLPKLSRAAANEGLTGLEWANGIPGTLGGALAMNAGAYGGEMSQVVTEILVFDKSSGDAKTITNFNFSYRHSIFHDRPELIALEATLKLSQGVPLEIKRRMDELIKSRNDKQPVNLPSAGSFFKRPKGHYAAALIEECGLKGFRVGGAMVSEKHSGFVVNIGGAVCDDVLKLASAVREKVYVKTGVELEPEVRLLGDVEWSF